MFEVEPIPKPILIPKLIRVSELLSGSEARFVISKPRSKEVIFEFWNRFNLCWFLDYI